MIGVWKRRNDQRREQAHADESKHDGPTLGIWDREEEMEAIRKRAIAEEQAIQAQVEVADNATRLLTADALQ
eukprot:5868869-Amphidinium_carterae.2